jgi:hypothetical protein
VRATGGDYGETQLAFAMMPRISPALKPRTVVVRMLPSIDRDAIRLTGGDRRWACRVGGLHSAMLGW